MGIAELINLEKEERQAYEENLKKHRDLKNVMDTRYNQGVNAGMELGKQDAVLRMYEIGIEISIICKVTGLDISEVSKILERAGLV